MQAVILAAGRGTRMGGLTENSPKSLLRVADRPLLQYTLDALPQHVDEAVIVVGYLGGMIHDTFGPEYAGKRILYVEQAELNGTAGALWQAQDILPEKYLVLNGDDLYDPKDIARLALARDWALLVFESPEMTRGGKVMIDAENRITGIVEGEHEGGPALENAGAYMLDTRIFNVKPVPKAEGSPEFGLPQTVLAASDALKIPLEALLTAWRLQITSPEDNADAARVTGDQ